MADDDARQKKQFGENKKWQAVSLATVTEIEVHALMNSAAMPNVLSPKIIEKATLKAEQTT